MRYHGASHRGERSTTNTTVLGQYRRQWACISLALFLRLVFDRIMLLLGGCSCSDAAVQPGMTPRIP